MRLNAPVARFGGLVLGLSIPFYALGAAHGANDRVIALPASALAVVVPATAAVVLTRVNGGSVRALLASGVTAPNRRTACWVGASLAAMPAILFTTHAVFIVPNEGSSAVTLPAAAAFAGLALVGAYCEETGWAAHAGRQLLESVSVVSAGLQVGALWAVWHQLPFVQTNRSWQWVLWQSAFTVAFRVLITSMLSLSGSTLIAVSPMRRATSHGRC